MKKRNVLLNLLVFLPIIAIYLYVYLNPSTACAYDATVRWDAPLKNANGTPLTDLAGYNVYYGKQHQDYESKIRVGNVKEYTITNLAKDVNYYCAVTAYDDAGNESLYSDEVSISGYSLTINKIGTGSGTVTSSPAGITCGTTCTNGYDDGSIVTLTATPAGNSTFTGWSGVGCSGTGQCVLVISETISVTANFSATTSSSQTIIDNRDAATSRTGTWNLSGGANPYGADSFWGRDGATFTWNFTPPQSGTYELSMWWTYYNDRSENVRVDIQRLGGTNTVYVNQKQNGSRWNSLGSYTFEAGSSYRVTIIAQSNSATACADAVSFNYITGTSETIIDNRDATTSKTGTWDLSGGANPYGADSVWSRNGATFTWNFTPSESGLYEISLWWTSYSGRSSSIPLDIQYASGKERVYINQQANGGKWNSLGNFYFNRASSYAITIISQPNPSSTCADAVKFKLVQ
jgi:hypothetical protein